MTHKAETSKQMKTKLLSLLCIFFISSCVISELKNNVSLEGSWRLYDIVPANEEEADFATTATLKRGVQDGGILSFFKDHHYSEMDGSGNFIRGKWEGKPGSSITLRDEKSNKKNVSLKSEKNQSGKTINSLAIEKDGLVYKYIKVAHSLEKPRNDPFHPSNNQWRIRPTKQENPKELSNKMAGYFKHLALLLKATKERKEGVVSFEYSKGPVKIYNGAIGIYPYHLVPPEWKNIFYNEGNALAAYSLFESYLKRSNYKGAGVGDWIEDDYNILQSIYADFNSMKK